MGAQTHCNCQDHYLELFQSFNDDGDTYNRMCYKCGKWWTHTVCKEKPSLPIIPKIYVCSSADLPLNRQWRHGEILMVDDGYGVSTIYAMNADGTIATKLTGV